MDQVWFLILGTIALQLIIILVAGTIGYGLGKYVEKVPKAENVFHKVVKPKRAPPKPYVPDRRPRPEPEQEQDDSTA